MRLRSVTKALLLGAAILAGGTARADVARPSGFPTGPQAPANAPNVLIIMTDDVGFGASSTFGGAIPTPTLDALAADGARYSGFHTALRIAMIGQNRPSPYEKANLGGPVGAVPVYHDLNALHTDGRGRFDVLLSPARPAGYTGDWWQLLPTTNKLFLRMVSDEWGKEQDPTIAIERADKPMGRPRQSAADLEQRLAQLPLQTRFSAMLFVDHVAKLAAEGYVNKLKVLDVSQMGGLKGQFYYEGDYDLADDEALIVEAKVPAHCQYRSMILTNEIYETTDWTDNQSSLNDSQARSDADGVLRVVVSTRDPGVPNWLDTAGYPKGLVQGRWTNCSEQPIPTVRKVAIADLRKALPPETGTVTPEQRDRIIRDRRMSYQLRPQW